MKKTNFKTLFKNFNILHEVFTNIIIIHYSINTVILNILFFKIRAIYVFRSEYIARNNFFNYKIILFKKMVHLYIYMCHLNILNISKMYIKE